MSGIMSPDAKENKSQETADEKMQEEDDVDDVTDEEFEALNNQLDGLNFALDNIEQRNDSIYAQLLLLLESSREIRKQMQQSNNINTSDQNTSIDN